MLELYFGLPESCFGNKLGEDVVVVLRDRRECLYLSLLASVLLSSISC